MKLAALFSNGMVVQRECPIPVWGWAEAGETITVELAGHSARATAARDGRWQAVLPALKAGGPHTLTAHGGSTLTVRDVLVGEVWVCSGQSNMEWILEVVTRAEVELPAANFPQMRLFTVPRLAAHAPERDVTARWTVCTPANASSFSAVGYFFGRELHRRLGVPVGLINTSWGGTVAQAWTSREGLAAEPALRGYLDALAVSPEKALAEYELRRAEFLKKLPQDPGNRGLAEGWASLEHDDAAWGTMDVPKYWSRAGHPTNGVFWFRRTVEIPAAWAGRDLQLALGAVDKSDDTYVNGQRVGGVTWVERADSWHTPREYTIPARLVKAGRNVIAVRVLSNYTGGGMAGPANAMQLQPQGLADAQPIPLSGAWRYKIEQDFGSVNSLPEPQSPQGANAPTGLFNGMIAPLVPYALRGAIWYQGESNADDAARYHTLFPAMIRDWRRHWKQGDFAFHFVQLANFIHRVPARESDDSTWAELREAQAAARALPNVGMAVTIDIGEPRDIHPRNKQDVGLRLALNALALTYGQNVQYAGPRFKSKRVEGRALRLEFDHAEGLTARGALSGFAVAGKDRVFHVAEARIEGRDVVVASPAVAAPVAARYGWADCPTCTLYNAAGLPAEPFRTDDWSRPGSEVGKQL